MAKSPAHILNVRAACALDLAPEKVHHTAGDTEDNHQHTENADPECDMVKEFHRMAYPPKRESTGSLVVQTNAVTLRIILWLVGAASNSLRSPDSMAAPVELSVGCRKELPRKRDALEMFNTCDTLAGGKVRRNGGWPFAESSSVAADRPRSAPAHKPTFSKVFRWHPPHPHACAPDSVEVVGSFTDWRETALTRDAITNTWQLRHQANAFARGFTVAPEMHACVMRATDES